jgi:protein tyrosine phosphatase
MDRQTDRQLHQGKTTHFVNIYNFFGTFVLNESTSQITCAAYIYIRKLVTLTCVYSAGVGRTGCFIVIDSMLERLRHEKMIDIYGHVTCLRAQRNYMVQVRSFCQ